MIFLRFSIEFTSLLRNFSNKNRYCIGVLRFCREDPKKNWGSQLGPWSGNRGGAAFAGPIPARARLAGGEGGVERLEEVALYLGVASDGVGGGRRGVVAGAVEAAAALRRPIRDGLGPGRFTGARRS